MLIFQIKNNRVLKQIDLQTTESYISGSVDVNDELKNKPFSGLLVSCKQNGI